MTTQPAGSRRRRCSPVAIVLGMIAAGMTPLAAEATSVVRFDLPQLVAASRDIVHGTVVAAASRWNEDRSLIVTETRVRVHGALKGGGTREVVVLQPGGKVGKLQVDVPGVAPFRPGEELVLFLVQDAGGRHYVAGLNQGRMPVIEDPGTGRKLVRGLAPAAEAAGKAPAAAPAIVDLQDFLDRVRALVRTADDNGGR